MIKAILFDFDGVLTLHETGSQSVCDYICSVTGTEKELFRRAYKKHNSDLLTGKVKHEDVWADICAAAGRDMDVDILYKSFINTPINPGMLRLVRDIKQSKYKVGMITDNKSDRIRSIIDYHNWKALFDAILVSAEVGVCKDKPQIFQKVFQTLEAAPEECVFIDNTQKNLTVPDRMGVATVFFDFAKNDVPGLRDTLSLLGVEGL
ncbi:MAG: HAD-IA family hydrolase [Oscillospiraceae bacterium]|jgi:putative hydrolase of the HAD superfamily|nr:HAD-IA family hydrolase [Oscillospiraceae bacterium]